jgi:diguanylate cyclase (GGDEF)-like protein
MADRKLHSEPFAPSIDGGGAALEAVLDATRALLWIETSEQATELARTLVTQFGGTLVPAASSGADTVPLDLSFGGDEPLLPSAPPVSVPRMLVERHLPGFVRDAYRALELADRTSRLSEAASLDALTGLANRRMLGRVLARLRPEDTVILLDLDHFKAVNDLQGHHEGDRVLRAFGEVLRSTVRGSDHAGRHGGEEFVVVLAGDQADAFLRRLTRVWKAIRPHAVTFSAGIAPAGENPGQALVAADRAMYRAKSGGRDQWQWAVDGDYR